MVEVSDSEDDFEVFNQPQSLEALTGDFGHLPSAEVSQTQGDPIIPEALGIQRKSRTSLIEIMESQSEGKAPEVAGQAKHPSLPTPHDHQPNPANKKRKREQKRKDVIEEGRGVPPKEIEL